MVSFSFLVTFLAVQAVHVYTAPTPSSELAVLESLPAIPQGWVNTGRSPSNSQRLRFRLAVRQENAFTFEQHVLAISTPGNEKYRQHMKRDELKAMLRPSSEASEAILGWLKTEGIPSTDIEDDGDWINFFVPATEAERILDTKFYFYGNAIADIERIRTLHYSIPKKLHQYVQMIQPTTRFGQMHPERSWKIDLGPARQNAGHYRGSQLNATFCNTTITPQCLRDLYNVGNYRGTSDNGNKLGICGYLKEYAK